jgi:hypothetical protein
MLSTPAMDHRFRKVEVRIKGIFVPILNLNLRQVEEMRKGFEMSDISKVFEVDDILGVLQAISRRPGENLSPRKGFSGITLSISPFKLSNVKGDPDF